MSLVRKGRDGVCTVMYGETHCGDSRSIRDDLLIIRAIVEYNGCFFIFQKGNNMELKNFDYLLRDRNCVIFEDFAVFKDYDVLIYDTNEIIKCNNIKETGNVVVNGKRVEEYINQRDNYSIEFDGGRGASSSVGMGGGFSSAGGNGKDNTHNIFPARLNLGGKNRSFEKTLDLFATKYRNQNHEFGAEVDDDGFVYTHVEGNSTNVRIGGTKNTTVIHNHPSGGNFSKGDLLSLASTNNKGIVAVGKKIYHVKKGNNFKTKQFVSAVKNAKWPSKMSYDEGADWWLKRNAKKLGYSYTVS